jgi:hypothetical protein
MPTPLKGNAVDDPKLNFASVASTTTGRWDR